MAIFLRGHERRKDGPTHTYWSLVENRRCAGGRVVQRHVLYLGKLTPAQELSWEKTAGQFEDKPRLGEARPGLASEGELECKEGAAIAVHLKQFRIERPRQWGACWVVDRLWRQLELEAFWRERLPVSREGTDWRQVLQTLVTYRLIEPGSEWRLHRDWYRRSAMADVLEEDFGLAQNRPAARTERDAARIYENRAAHNPGSVQDASETRPAKPAPRAASSQS